MTTIKEQKKTQLSADEIEERKRIMEQIDASNLLEGISPAEEDSLEKKLEKQWIHGEITSDEATTILKEHYGIK